MNFKCLSYSCRYDYSIGEERADLNPYKCHACYSEVFHSISCNEIKDSVKIYYKFLFYKTDLDVRNCKNNFCALSKNNIIRTLQFLYRIFPFKYRLKEKEECYILSVVLNSMPLYHKFFMSFMRCFYEFPMNFIASEVYRIKDNVGSLDGINFKKINFFNLYNIIYKTYDTSDAVHG